MPHRGPQGRPHSIPRGHTGSAAVWPAVWPRPPELAGQRPNLAAEGSTRATEDGEHVSDDELTGGWPERGRRRAAGRAQLRRAAAVDVVLGFWGNKGGEYLWCMSNPGKGSRNPRGDRKWVLTAECGRRRFELGGDAKSGRSCGEKTRCEVGNR